MLHKDSGMRLLRAGKTFRAAFVGDREAVANSPKLILPHGVFRRLKFYFASLSHEFQLMGFIERSKEGFVLTDLAIPHQTCGISHAIRDQSRYGEFLEELANRGKSPADLRFQAHSHGDNAAFFSATDVQAIRTAYVCDWMISFVGNRAGDFLARLDVFRPIPLSVDLPIFVSISDTAPMGEPTKEEETAWAEELASHMMLTFPGKLLRLVFGSAKENA